MPDTLPTTPDSLETLLAPYEARNPVLASAEAVARRRSYALGDELNRIQGAASHPEAVERLRRLWCAGKINRGEYFELLGELGRAGLLSRPEVSARGR